MTDKTIINAGDLIAETAKSLGKPQAIVKDVLNDLLATIQQRTAQGAIVRLRGFGQFVVKHTDARPGVNPLTKERIEIPASSRLKFKAQTARNRD